MMEFISALFGRRSSDRAKEAALIVDLKAQVAHARRVADEYEIRAEEAVRAGNALQVEVDQLRAQVANAEMDGPKRDLEKANDAQAARAMSRNTKNAFVAYQEGVKAVVKELDKVCSKNSFTVRDLDTVQNVRRELRGILNREI